MAKKALWILFAVLSTMIGFYPAIYFIQDRKFGLLSSKSDELLTNIWWNAGFYTHIIFGGLALLIGWMQFSPKIRNKYLALHRRIGRVYVIAALLSSTAGACIGFFATGGLVSSLGFIGLGVIWFYTTLSAYTHIRNKRTGQHERMMTYSYAACFAAVTLRLWLPFLINWFGDFVTAYRIVAWLCWIPNMVVAHAIIFTRLRVKKSRSYP